MELWARPPAVPSRTQLPLCHGSSGSAGSHWCTAGHWVQSCQQLCSVFALDYSRLDLIEFLSVPEPNQNPGFKNAQEAGKLNSEPIFLQRSFVSFFENRSCFQKEVFCRDKSEADADTQPLPSARKADHTLRAPASTVQNFLPRAAQLERELGRAKWAAEGGSWLLLVGD